MFWLGADTSIKSGWFKLALETQTSPLGEMMQLSKCFPHASKMSTLTRTTNITLSVQFQNLIKQIDTNDTHNPHDDILSCLGKLQSNVGGYTKLISK